MDAWFISVGAALTGMGVALGAFGAHALERRMGRESLQTYRTGVRYQMIHALGLIVVGLTLDQYREATELLTTVGWLFMVGIALFSSSLYLLVLTGRRWLGAITPFGGLAWIFAWALLALIPLIQ
jgi:uncharacterized membrane protein YgdD (TMEM256/DUF423 family)